MKKSLSLIIAVAALIFIFTGCVAPMPDVDADLLYMINNFINSYESFEGVDAHALSLLYCEPASIGGIAMTRSEIEQEVSDAFGTLSSLELNLEYSTSDITVAGLTAQINIHYSAKYDGTPDSGTLNITAQKSGGVWNISNQNKLLEP